MRSMTKKLNKILVTGGTGFIGTHVVNRLLSLGYEVEVTIRNDNHQKNPNVTYHSCDIRDREGISDAVSLCDGVINLAGILGTSLEQSDTKDSVDVNIRGALNVFNACQAYDIPCVHITVGNTHWLNNYSTTKYASERFAIMYNNELKTRISIIRAFNVYGPGQKHEPVKKAIPNFILNSLQGKPLTVYGDGSQKMDFIYIDDLVEILIRTISHEHGVHGTPIQAGTGKAISIKQVVETIKKLTNSKSEINYLPMRKGEPEHSVVEAKVSTLEPLGFKPQISFEEGISKTIPYYQNLIN